MSELIPLCAAKRILIWRPDWRERDAHASARLVRLAPKVFAVAGLALRIVVYRRHDRLIACTSTWLPGTVMRTCSARVQRCRTFQSAAMNWDGSVSGSYQWVLS
jgi:hypothetical protein